MENLAPSLISGAVVGVIVLAVVILTNVRLSKKVGGLQKTVDQLRQEIVEIEKLRAKDHSQVLADIRERLGRLEGQGSPPTTPTAPLSAPSAPPTPPASSAPREG